MAVTELIGRDGKIAQVATSEVTTGTLTAGAKYIVKTIGGSSALPTGAAVKKAFIADGTEDISASGDVVYLLTETDKCDISEWSISLNSPEINMTTLCDDVNVYRAGRPDLSGSMTGIYKIGTTDVDDGVLNAFVDIVRQADDGGAITIDQQSNGELFLLLYKQKDDTAGETEQLYIAPVVVTSYDDNITSDDKQGFTSSFRISPSDIADFHMLSVLHA